MNFILGELFLNKVALRPSNYIFSRSESLISYPTTSTWLLLGSVNGKHAEEIQGMRCGEWGHIPSLPVAATVVFVLREDCPSCSLLPLQLPFEPWILTSPWPKVVQNAVWISPPLPTLHRQSFLLHFLCVWVCCLASCRNSDWYWCLRTVSVQFSSVTQSWPTLCDPMDCSMPGLPVHHQFPEFTQTHVHWVGDAIKDLILCCTLLPPSIFPSIRVFAMSQLFTSRGQSIGVSAST